jgi:hypothetical protein
MGGERIRLLRRLELVAEVEAGVEVDWFWF